MLARSSYNGQRIGSKGLRQVHKRKRRKKEPGKILRNSPSYLLFALLIAAAFGLVGGAEAAKLTLRQVSEVLAKATAGHPPDFSHDDLSFLDLSDLDFKQAKFIGANLYGANLSNDNLSGADLSDANLDHAVITRTNFAGANLTNASLYDTAAYSMLEPSPSEAPNFAGVNLSSARVMARLTGVDMHGADLAHVQMGIRRDQLKTPLWTDLSGCNLTNTNLTGADLHGVHLAFAKLINADLAGANLALSDLTHADLTGANVAGADFTGADLDGTIMRVESLNEVHGLEHARNRERAVH